MNTFLQFAARITGAEYERLQRATPACRTKVRALGLAVLIPATLWAVCSFMLAYAVLETGFVAAIITALVLGFMVLTIERLIVMGKGNRLVTLFRILLAGIVAFLGSQLFDLVLFKKDIEHVMPRLRHEEALQAQKMKQAEWDDRNQLPEKTAALQNLWNVYQQRQDDAIMESGGLAGSGIKGANSATKFKQQQADVARADYERAKAELDNLQAAISQKKQEAYDSAYARFDEKSLLYRIKAMEVLLRENTDMKKVYWGVTLFLFLIEFLVLIFKLTWPQTAYEQELEMLSNLHRRRSETIMSTAVAQHQPHQVVPHLQQASRQLQQRLNTFL
ncbi:MAG: DUF4407 domain-containing protein [Lacibacter sp.]